MSNFLKIISLEYSGSTLADLLFSNFIPNSVSLGEAERTVESDSIHIENTICSCLDLSCKYWPQNINGYSDLQSYLQNNFPENIFIDSSKTLSSLAKSNNVDYSVIFLYRSCSAWSLSCLKRFFKQEVKPFKSRRPIKMLIPFIRIEILRRLVFFLPFEWFFRNIRILFYLNSLALKRHIPVYALSYDDLTSHYQGKRLSFSHSHIKRGNKISKSRSSIVVMNSNSIQSPFDRVLKFLISRSSLRSLTLHRDFSLNVSLDL